MSSELLYDFTRACGCCVRGCSVSYLKLQAAWYIPIPDTLTDTLYKASHMIINDMYSDWLGTGYFDSIETEFDACTWFNVPANNAYNEFWWLAWDESTSTAIFEGADEFGSPLTPVGGLQGPWNQLDEYYILGEYADVAEIDYDADHDDLVTISIA